jgi:hypothetical protein
MSHQRSLIRTALKNMLVAANTGAVDRVYTNRTHNLKGLGAIIISDEGETAVPRNITGAQYIRTLLIEIEITVTANADYDIVMDNLAKEVEDVMASNRSISGTAINSVYINTDMKFDAGERSIAQASLHYEIKYIA